MDAEFAKYLPPEKEKEFDRTVKDENMDVDEIVKRHGKKHEKKEKVVVVP